MLFSALYHLATAITAAVSFHILDLPSLSLNGLHTYIHPDSIPSSSSGLRAALRSPSATDGGDISDKRRRRHSPPDEPAQLLRLCLSNSHLSSRPFFSFLRTTALLFLISLSNLLLRFFVPDNVVPTLTSAAACVYALSSLFRLSVESSASTRLQRQLSLLFALIGFFVAVGCFCASVFSAVLAGCLTGLLFIPAIRHAKCYWIGTDQLRFNLSVIACGGLAKIILQISQIVGIAASLLFIESVVPLALKEGLGDQFKQLRVWALAAAATLQLLAFRTNVQMYLNEAVLCWYQRLHSSRVPDMDYGRAKVFLHNHYFCLVGGQLLAPPVMVIMLLGVSQLRGNLLDGVLINTGLVKYSDAVKETSLFLAWWIMFVSAVLTLSYLLLYRCGFLLIS